MEVCPVSRMLPEYPDICKLLKTAFPRSKQIPMWILQLLARQKDVYFQAFYDEDQFCGILYTAVIVSKGRYIGKYRKIYLSDFEKKIFDRGNENLVFEVEGIKIGIQICFDLWFPEVSREQLRMGADLLCVLANFGGDTTYHISKIRAIENLAPLALCNRIGVESIPEMDAEFLGKSTVISASGQRVYIAPEKHEDFGLCDIDIAKNRSNVICSNFDSKIAFHYQSL